MGIDTFHGTRPNPKSMPPPGGIDELNMHGDVVPLHRDAFELRRSRCELHPCSNRHRIGV